MVSLCANDLGLREDTPYGVGAASLCPCSGAEMEAVKSGIGHFFLSFRGLWSAFKQYILANTAAMVFPAVDDTVAPTIARPVKDEGSLGDLMASLRAILREDGLSEEDFPRIDIRYPIKTSPSVIIVQNFEL